MTNCVHIAGQLMNKSGTQINLKKFYEEYEKDPSYINVEDKSCPYVSRGAYKLKAAYEEFKLDFKDSIVLDIGASTGGFSDFALQHGARRILAIDVGKNQLHYRLQEDPRVFSLEEKNFKHLEFAELAEQLDSQPINFAVADLSFISLTKILDKLKELIEKSNSQNLQCVFLIKPQFEAGREIADKFKGIITDAKIRDEIVQRTIQAIEADGFKLMGLKESPIKGAKGNIEYLSLFVVNP